MNKTLLRAPGGRLLVCPLVIAAIAFAPRLAGAQSAPPAAAGAGSSTTNAAEKPAQDDAKQRANALFNEGLALFMAESWDAAAVKFEASYELFPTKNALMNAGDCYNQKHRYVEALERYETLLANFANLEAEEKSKAQTALNDLRSLVATIDVSAAEPGASIRIDDEQRGEFPLPKPLRLAIGTYKVTVFKEGFEPFSKTVKLAGGPLVTIEAQLPKITSKGHVRIVEKDNRSLTVYIDDVARGTTPWEGDLPVGAHSVRLRAAGVTDHLGTAPAALIAEAGKPVSLSLRAEELDTTLHLKTTPTHARIFIDDVEVGNEKWFGQLRSGTHHFEVRADGYETWKSGDLTLVKGKVLNQDVSLKRALPEKVVFDGAVLVGFSPGFGGQIASNCSKKVECGDGALQGLIHVGYAPGNGWEAGGTAQYMLAGGSHKEHTVDVLLEPFSSQTAKANVTDQLVLQGGTVGGYAAYQFAALPVLLRGEAGIGALSLEVARTGSMDYGLSLSQRVTQQWVFLFDTSLELLYRLSHSSSADVMLGLRGTVGWMGSATWVNNPAHPLNADAGYGEGRYAPQTLNDNFLGMGGLVLSVRWDLALTKSASSTAQTAPSTSF